MRPSPRGGYLGLGLVSSIALAGWGQTGHGAERAVTLSRESVSKIGLETESARLSAVGERLTLLGTLDVDRDEPLLAVRAPAAGTVAELRVETGDSVKKGETLARIGDLPVVAPAWATVAEVRERPGATVAEGQVILSLLDLSHLVAYLSVYEDQLPEVRSGQSVILSLPALPQRAYPGRLEDISPGLDPTTHAAVARAKLANAEGDLRPGMAVQGTIATGGARKGIVVPQAAVVFDSQGGSWVYVQTGRLSFVRRPVEVQFIGGRRFWVKRGLAAGEVYVSVGAQELFSEEFSGRISTED